MLCVHFPDFMGSSRRRTSHICRDVLLTWAFILKGCTGYVVSIRRVKSVEGKSAGGGIWRLFQVDLEIDSVPGKDSVRIFGLNQPGLNYYNFFFKMSLLTICCVAVSFLLRCKRGLSWSQRTCLTCGGKHELVILPPAAKVKAFFLF